MFIQTIFCCYNIKNREEKTIFRSSAGPKRSKSGCLLDGPRSLSTETPDLRTLLYQTWKRSKETPHHTVTPPKLLTSPPCEEPHTHKHHPHKTTEKLYNTAASKAGRILLRPASEPSLFGLRSLSFCIHREHPACPGPQAPRCDHTAGARCGDSAIKQPAPRRVQREARGDTLLPTPAGPPGSGRGSCEIRTHAPAWAPTRGSGGG